MDKYAPVDALPAAAGSLQEIVEPQGAKADTDTKGLAGKTAGQQQAAATKVSAEDVAHELAEGNVSQ